MRTIPRATTTAALRRIHITLVDATDRVTPEDINPSGVKPTLTIDGATPAPGNQDLVKVSGTVGEYYVQLTEAEVTHPLNTVIRGWVQPAGCALTKFEAQIGAAALETEPPALNVSGGVVESNVKQVNGATVLGNGTAGNLWRGA